MRRRPNAREAREVDLRHRPRGHRHPGQGRAGAGGRGQDQGGPRARGLRRAGVGVARGARLGDHRAVQAHRGLARLLRRALHDGRGLRARRASTSSWRSTRRAWSTRGHYMVNWDPGTRSAISDLEVEQRQMEDTLYSVDYPLASGSGAVTVATVRPETMLADTAIAVNPDDERYTRLIGETAILPLVGRRLPIVADEHVRADFGTGALKVTPGHDPNDFEIGSRHGLEVVSVIGEDGRMSAAAGERFAGLPTAEAQREVVAALREEGLVSGTHPYTHDVPHSQRSGMRIEPLISLQWFCDMEKLAAPAIAAVKDGPASLPPREAVDRGLPRLAGEHPPLVRLAPALVGPPSARVVPGRRDPRGARGRPRGTAGSRTPTCSTRGSRRRCGRSRRSAGPSRPPSCAPSTRRTCSRRRGTSSSSGSRGWSCSAWSSRASSPSPTSPSTR